MKSATCLVHQYLSECKPVGGVADVLGNLCSLEVRARETPTLNVERSQNEGTFRIVGNLGADMLDPPLPFGSEKVEAEAIFSRIGFRQEAGPKYHPLGCIHETLED
jgi:hypothetical protein